MDVQHPLCKGNSANNFFLKKKTISDIAKIISCLTDADNDSRDTSTKKQGMSKTCTHQLYKDPKFLASITYKKYLRICRKAC
jgi:hypothetical protein